MSELWSKASEEFEQFKKLMFTPNISGEELRAQVLKIEQACIKAQRLEDDERKYVAHACYW